MQLSTAFLLLIPIVFFITLFIWIRYLRKNPPSYRFKKNMYIVGMVCAIVSIIAILASYYISRHTIELVKLAMPLMLLVLLNASKRKLEKQSTTDGNSF
jgi:uncharacterized membrane protein YfcA